jgi:hypothetical protein
MAQSALTVTPPNPTPPTNFACTGVTGPNPPNYRRSHYANPFNMDVFGRPQAPYGVNPNPPPYFDDGVAAAGTAFIAPTAALAGGTSAADDAGTAPGFNGTTVAAAGGTGVNQTSGTYPVAGGLVPASSSAVHEGAGTEVVVTKIAGSGATDYNPAVFLPLGTAQMVTVASGPVATQATRDAGPNASHASTLSPAANPTFTSFTAGSSVSGVGTTTLSCVTVGATKQSVVYVNGVAQTTVFVSSTSLTCAAVTKKTTAGNWDIKIVTGGVVETAPRTWTFT